jgi:hypothetical protein
MLRSTISIFRAIIVIIIRGYSLFRSIDDKKLIQLTVQCYGEEVYVYAKIGDRIVEHANHEGRYLTTVVTAISILFERTVYATRKANNKNKISVQLQVNSELYHFNRIAGRGRAMDYKPAKEIYKKTFLPQGETGSAEKD